MSVATKRLSTAPDRRQCDRVVIEGTPPAPPGFTYLSPVLRKLVPRTSWNATELLIDACRMAMEELAKPEPTSRRYPAAPWVDKRRIYPGLRASPSEVNHYRNIRDRRWQRWLDKQLTY